MLLAGIRVLTVADKCITFQCVLCCQMDDVLKERCDQLKASHQADVDCLKDEHEKNLKNLMQEFQDKVCVVSV